jgi:aspartyl/asparaginyl beta-hydroxylase (cupin superfamily)
VLAQEIGQLLAAAQQARAGGRIEEESTLLARAGSLAPDDPLVANTRGVHALGRGAWNDARAFFETAIKADPTEAALWMNLATACRSARDDEGEQRSLEGALAIDRRHVMAQYRMAGLFQRTDRPAQAAQGWSHVAQLLEGIENPPSAVRDMLSEARAYLAKHNEAIAKALDDALSDQIDMLGTQGKRLRACIDHSLGRRRIYPNVCAGIHYPFLPADEFFDRAHFPWFAELEARTGAIKAEAEAILSGQADMIRPYVRMEKGGPETKWSRLDGSLDWTACFLWEYGVRNDAVCNLCPETAKALEAVPQSNIPGKAPSAFFSLLRPGAHIPPHTGVTNSRSIIHLPLIVPDNCDFRVGGETRSWKEGEAFGFDDTIEHEAWNHSDKPRVVLIFDVWNPHLSAAEQALLSRMFEITGISA